MNPTGPSDPAVPRPGSPEALRGFGIGSIGGVRIVVAPSWVASVAVIVALGVPVITQVVPGTDTGLAVVVSIILGVLLGLSVLAHELGHCLAARLLGMRVVGVRLYLLGGVSEMARTPRSPREEAVIAAAGPAVSAILAGVFWLVLQAVEPSTVTWLAVLLLALSNLVVALFNLLPALPLDGGRVLRAGVWRVSGNRGAGTTAAVIGGLVIAVALVGWAVLMIIDEGTSALLPAGIAVAMGLFVAVGAAAERSQPTKNVWPADVTIQSLARPVAQLPTETPVAQALDVAADRTVILTEADGVARGMLDVPAARELAQRDPLAPASLVARAWLPETIVLSDDDPAELAARTRTVNAAAFLLVDGAGQPAGVLRREDIIAVLTRRRSHWWERTSRTPSRPAQSRKGPG